MTCCHICDGAAMGEWLDFGPQALTNRFLQSREEVNYVHPCRLGVCRACGTLQLESPVPVAEMRPRFDWITYNEPERHLDEVAGIVANLPGITRDSAVGGITYKDESTLKRLNALGISKTWLAHIHEDLGVKHPLGGIESVQEQLTVAPRTDLWLSTADRQCCSFGTSSNMLTISILYSRRRDGSSSPTATLSSNYRMYARRSTGTTTPRCGKNI